MHIEHSEFCAGRQQLTNARGLAGQNHGHRALKSAAVGAFIRRTADDWKHELLLHLVDDDAAQLRVGLDHQPVSRRLNGEPAAEARSDESFRRAKPAPLCRHFADELIDRNLRRERGSGPGGLHVYPTAVTELKPALAFQFAISGADRVGMNAEPAREFPRAGQSLAGEQLLAKNAQHDLGDQLLAQ